MSSEKLYRKKYLKYKNKYINLQTQIGGNYFIKKIDSILYIQMKKELENILKPYINANIQKWGEYIFNAREIIEKLKHWEDYLKIIKERNSKEYQINKEDIDRRIISTTRIINVLYNVLTRALTEYDNVNHNNVDLENFKISQFFVRFFQ